MLHLPISIALGKNCKSSTNIWWQFHFSSLWVTSSIMMSYIWFILLLLYDHFLFYGRLTGSTEIRSFWRFNQSFVSSRSPEIRISSLLITDDISFTWNTEASQNYLINIQGLCSSWFWLLTDLLLIWTDWSGHSIWDWLTISFQTRFFLFSMRLLLALCKKRPHSIWNWDFCLTILAFGLLQDLAEMDTDALLSLLLLSIPAFFILVVVSGFVSTGWVATCPWFHDKGNVICTIMGKSAESFLFFSLFNAGWFPSSMTPSFIATWNKSSVGQSVWSLLLPGLPIECLFVCCSYGAQPNFRDPGNNKYFVIYPIFIFLNSHDHWLMLQWLHEGIMIPHSNLSNFEKARNWNSKRFICEF